MIELIPAIDIIDGKCVRLSQGDYNTQKVYNENPVEVAKEFEAHGIHRLHIVDLDGAVSRHVVNYRVLDQIASRTSLVIDFGGGIKNRRGPSHRFRQWRTNGNPGQRSREKSRAFQKMAGTIRKRENHSGS